MEGGGSIFDSLIGAAGDIGTSYFDSRKKVPPAATANTQARRQQDLTVPLAIGGAAILVVLLLVFAFRR